MSGTARSPARVAFSSSSSAASGPAALQDSLSRPSNIRASSRPSPLSHPMKPVPDCSMDHRVHSRKTVLDPYLLSRRHSCPRSELSIPARSWALMASRSPAIYGHGPRIRGCYATRTSLTLISSHFPKFVGSIFVRKQSWTDMWKFPALPHDKTSVRTRGDKAKTQDGHMAFRPHPRGTPLSPSGNFLLYPSNCHHQIFEISNLKRPSTMAAAFLTHGWVPSRTSPPSFSSTRGSRLRFPLSRLFPRGAMCAHCSPCAKSTSDCTPNAAFQPANHATPRGEQKGR
ncbi:C5 protein [Persimmon circular DNA virus]|nr:C5 protein [Persimmon circular DNA virus]